MSDPVETEGEAGAQPGRSRKFLALIPLLLFGALAVVFLFRLEHAGESRKIPSALIGKPAPTFTLEPIEGLMRDGAPLAGLSSADLAGNGVTVVNIWASWCVPCRQEHGTLMEMAKDERFRLVGINYKDKPENARRFLGELGNPFAAAGSDQSGRVGIDWGVYGVPETYVVDNAGMIRFKYVGPLTDGVLNEGLYPAVEKARAEAKAGG
ncbi:MAG: DsbE family thiol:disulfide interchange protein [Hyphomicrobiales bacterium]